MKGISKSKKIVIFVVACLLLTLSSCVFSNKEDTVGEDDFSAYEKLMEGKPVNILIVGDSIGAGTGADSKENSWPEIVSDYLNDKYGSKIKLTNVSMGGCSSLCGYVRVQNITDGVDYDLAIVCYGENDEEQDFGLYYESILRVLRAKYPNVNMICIQESSQRDYTPKMLSIARIADHYNVPIADTIEPFASNYDNLVVDGCHPNNDGHRIYADVIENIIDNEVINGIYREESISPLDKNTAFFDHYQWISKENFKKIGNKLTAKINYQVIGSGEKTTLSDGKGVFVVADIVDHEGDNNFRIYSNDEEIMSREFFWPYSFGQRHIPILLRNAVLDKGTISIEFENEDQIVEFEGIGFIG